MSGSQRDHGPIVVGGEPRIDFLPTETKKRKENRRQRRSFVALVIVVALACAVGYVFTAQLAVSGQVALDKERLLTKDLISQQGEYSEAASAVNTLRTIGSAQIVGSAPEILWADYLKKVQAALPAGAAFVSYSVDGLSSLETLPEIKVLLQQPRVATITFVFSTPTIQVADAVLVSLEGRPFYADSTISVIDWDEEHLYYAVSATLNITAESFAYRYMDATSTETED